VRLAWRITSKDWAESRRIILALTGGLLLPAGLLRFGPEQAGDFAMGFLGALLAGAGFGYAQHAFLNERQRGTLELLLGLPIGPRQLVLAKYVSLYSMVLFTVNVPGAILADLRLIYIVNAAALSAATLFMAATVVSDKPWAPQIPIYFLMIFVVPADRLLTRYYPEGLEMLRAITARPLRLATAALLATPVLVGLSVAAFEHQTRRRQLE
jgi:ABC-type Na+ efflux pump permease subunit